MSKVGHCHFNFPCSGGLNLLVTGTNLDVIETPKIFFKYPLEDNHTVAIEVSVV